MRRNCGRTIIYTLVFALLVSGWACAGDGIRLSAERLTVGETLIIEVEDQAQQRAMTLLRDGTQVNTGALTQARHAALYAREPGQYTLIVQPEGGQESRAAFTVYEELDVTLNPDHISAGMGERLTAVAAAQGGVPPLRYEFSVTSGSRRVAAQNGDSARFEWVPFEQGDMRLTVTVTDAAGHTASAAGTVEVSDQGGIAVTGDTQTVLGQGGIRRLTVQSPGPWSAKTDEDFITLLNDCGEAGDELRFAVGALNGDARTGRITLNSLGLSCDVTVRQVADREEEEEVYLFSSVGDRITVNGQSNVSWLCPADGAGTLTVDISASGEWTVASDARFVRWEREGDLLRIYAEANTSAQPRNANLLLSCGQSGAAIGIAQPGASAGASVREVILDRDRGAAYMDQVSAMVLTDETASRVGVIVDRQAPVWTEAGRAERTENGLRWRLTLPLTGAGAQSWLFVAANDQGSADKALAVVNVEAEAPMVVGDVEYADDGRGFSVWATRTVQSVETLDEQGEVMRTYRASQAKVDEAADVSGRYVRWTLTVTGSARPSSVRAGDTQISLDWPERTADDAPAQEENAFQLYSQEDGTWHEVPYRKSTLEHSGCAIFALSHALQLLGHTEPESLPAQLAKTYAFCLVDGGTLNSTLVGNAAKAFGFKTKFNLYRTKEEIVRFFKQGAVFSFSVARGHIALTDRLSADGKMCHIIDSAPRATFSKIKNETPMLYDEASKNYVPLSSPAEIPGLRYYVDTEGYGAAEYWLSLDYVTSRGVRLILRQ